MTTAQRTIIFLLATSSVCAVFSEAQEGRRGTRSGAAPVVAAAGEKPAAGEAKPSDKKDEKEKDTKKENKPLVDPNPVPLPDEGGQP